MKQINITITLIIGIFICMNMTWAESLVIKGSTTVLPIAQKVAEAYMKTYPDIKIPYPAGAPVTVLKQSLMARQILPTVHDLLKARKSNWPLKKGPILFLSGLLMTASYLSFTQVIP